MTAAENSYVGLAPQSAKGVPNTTDGDFRYFMFNEGSMSPNNVYLPADDGVGGGALLSTVAKVGVTSAGAFASIPRPAVVGDFLLGALGNVADPVADGTGWKHVFTLGADQFAAPYWTLRENVGDLWGEQFQDIRLSAFMLNWRAADYIRSQQVFTGGLPTPDQTTTTWGEAAAVDRGAEFLAPVTAITWPDETPKVLSGQIAMGMAIPLDEQWVTGSYQPDDFDIVSRAFSVTMTMKLIDQDLYEKMAYDPAQGGTWLADIFKEGGVTIQFDATQEYDTGKPYRIKVIFDAANDNVAWSITPIALRAGRQILMTVTGTVLASAAEPIQVELYNDVSAKYGTVT